MSSIKLKLNSDTTELLQIASQLCPKPQLSSLNVCGNQISPSVSVRNVAVVVDSYMKFDRQVSSICKVSFFYNRNISRIREYLSVESANLKILVHASITCRLDNGMHCYTDFLNISLQNFTLFCTVLLV